jgi:hypothetical protein
MVTVLQHSQALGLIHRAWSTIRWIALLMGRQRFLWVQTEISRIVLDSISPLHIHCAPSCTSSWPTLAHSLSNQSRFRQCESKPSSTFPFFSIFPPFPYCFLLTYSIHLQINFPSFQVVPCKIGHVHRENNILYYYTQPKLSLECTSCFADQSGHAL